MARSNSGKDKTSQATLLLHIHLNSTISGNPAPFPVRVVGGVGGGGGGSTQSA